MASLLPNQIKDFRSKTYWDDFFTKREEKSFEWYGEWKNIKRFTLAYCKLDSRMLLIGNGNSNIAADMCDGGYKKLTAIDFSEVVIKEMSKKYSSKVPALKFELMDMLKMKYEDKSYDIVFDKATLDAIMTDDSHECQIDVDKMFSEISRVLTNNGRYICITLLQTHIINKLINILSSSGGWKIVIHQIMSPYESDSPLCPFFLVATKDTSILPTQSSFTLKFNPVSQGNETNTKQTSENVMPSEIVAKIHETQASFSMLHKLSILRAGEVTKLDLWGGGITKGTEINQMPRFQVTVVDDDDAVNSIVSVKCGVLIVPLGRNHEWMFASEKGQKQLVASSGYSRLIICCMNRGHTFENLESVQKELSPSMPSLCPRNVLKPIPFLTVSSDIGCREVRNTKTSLLSGELLVEDVKSSESDEETTRRLVFLLNQHAIQSEARVVGGAVDLSYLCFDYHIAIVSSLGLNTQILTSPSPSKAKSIIVGLGGGALPSFLSEHFSCFDLNSVELDEMVIEVAKSDFDFRVSPTCNVTAGDGVDFILKNKIEDKVSVLIIDADSKDLSIGMSFPPASFLTLELLTHVKKILASDSIFAINISGQNDIMYKDTVLFIKSIFSSSTFYELAIEDQFNKILAIVNYENDVSKKCFEPVKALEILEKERKKIWSEDMDILQNLQLWKVI